LYDDFFCFFEKIFSHLLSDIYIQIYPDANPGFRTPGAAVRLYGQGDARRTGAAPTRPSFGHPGHGEVFMIRSTMVWVCLLLGTVMVAAAESPELAEAARAGDLARVEALLEAGVDAGATNGGETPALALAAVRGHEAVVRLLLDRGAELGACAGRERLTALMCAAANGHAGVVRLLLERGAAVDAGNRHGYTALMLAAGYGRLETAGILLTAGASVAAATETGWTALMSAAGSGHADVVERLITAGADVNAWTRDSGTTPLLCAVGNGHTEVVRLLLARGADAALADSDGVTAAALARKLEHAEITRLLAPETAAVAGRRPLPQPDPVDPGRGFTQ